MGETNLLGLKGATMDSEVSCEGLRVKRNIEIDTGSLDYS